MDADTSIRARGATGENPLTRAQEEAAAALTAAEAESVPHDREIVREVPYEVVREVPKEIPIEVIREVPVPSEMPH